jgi:hypothetical protein
VHLWPGTLGSHLSSLTPYTPGCLPRWGGFSGRGPGTPCPCQVLVRSCPGPPWLYPTVFFSPLHKSYEAQTPGVLGPYVAEDGAKPPFLFGARLGPELSLSLVCAFTNSN